MLELALNLETAWLLSGPSSFNVAVTNLVNTTVTAQGGDVYRIEKTGGSAGVGDAAAISDVVLNDFVIRVDPGTGTNSDFGVSANPSLSIDLIEYGFTWDGGGTVYKFETGAGYSAIGSFTIATEYLFLRRVGTTVTVLKGTSGNVGSATLLGTLSASVSGLVGFDSVLTGAGTTADVLVTGL